MSVAPPMPAAPAPGVATPPPVPVARPTPPDHVPWAMPLALYERIVEAGLLNEYRHVYLWEGRLCVRMGIDPPHGLGVKGIYDALKGLGMAGYDAETEMPIAFRKADNAPQPDVKVVRGRCKDYNPRMPTTADVPLVVEVTDSILSKDRGLAQAYAMEEIPVYWLLNLNTNQMEVYSEPVNGVYTSVRFYKADEELPVILDGREMGRLRVSDLLP